VGEGERGENRGGHHLRGLRADDRPAGVEAVDEGAADEAGDGVGQALEEGENAERHRRPGQLDDEPGLGDVLDPGAGDRDALPGEEQPVVVMAAEAAEGSS
jgi:hypothetical protein